MRRILVAGGLAAGLLTSVAVGATQSASTTASASVAPTGGLRTVQVTDPTTTTTSSPPSTTTTTAPTTTTTAAAPAPRPARVPLGALTSVWRRTPAGSCLMVMERGRVLFERSPDRPVIPASTMKLLTATAALNRLGRDTRLRTTVMATAAPVDGLVQGDLWLVGGGDPLLGTGPWAGHFTRQPAMFTPLEWLADAVVNAGIRQVTGQVIGDDSRYDAVRRVPSWPARYTEQGEVGPLTALSVNDGFATWGNRGEPFADPAAGAAQTLTNLLRARGVGVAGPGTSGIRPEGLVETAAVSSRSVRQLVGQMLRESDNGTAELLLKELARAEGVPGSTSGGLRAVAEAVTGAGLPARGLRQIDGSGLGRGNLVTCRLLAALVDRNDPDIVAGLAVAGRSGTLEKRFVGTAAAGRLRGKTGSIKAVAALAGQVETAGGRRVTFAYVINNLRSSRITKPLQEALANALVASGSSRSSGAGGA